MDVKKEDPVCGMSVDPQQSPHQHTHGGARYNFCSVDCKDKFVADPGAYLGDCATASSADALSIYTCPNLPNLDQTGPGDCPFCGSQLELKDPIAALVKDENPVLVDTRRRFWVSLVRWFWPWAKNA